MGDTTMTENTIPVRVTDASVRECVMYGNLALRGEDTQQIGTALTVEISETYDAWLAAHDAEVAANALREAHADLQAYTDAGAPFGHRPVEDFLLSRADRIEREATNHKPNGGIGEGSDA